MIFYAFIYIAISAASAPTISAPATSAMGVSAPLPLFDARFSPPLSGITSFNSEGRLLALQLDDTGAAPARVLSIDRRGRVETVDELSETAEISVPAGRLWIAGVGERPGEAENSSAESRRLPVTEVKVYLAGGGDAYTVVYKTRGAYYEVRHKDAHGRLLFITAPRDGYGLKAVHVSRDGGSVLVVDESPDAGGPVGVAGQRLYFYNGQGRLVADHDSGGDTEGWLNASEGLMARDGSYFAATRGRGANPASSIVLFDGNGDVLWEKSFFKTHRLIEDFGGVFLVKGGSGSLISLINSAGEMSVIERAGYGFELWLSEDADYAYFIKFRAFDIDKSGMEASVKESFPKAKPVAVDLNALMPKGAGRPGVAIAGDGTAFVHYCFEKLGGQEVTDLALYDTSLKELWRDHYYGSVLPQFVEGGRGFVLKFGYPITRLVYYGSR